MCVHKEAARGKRSSPKTRPKKCNQETELKPKPDKGVTWLVFLFWFGFLVFCIRVLGQFLNVI